MVNRRRCTRLTVSDDEDEAPRPRRTRKILRLLEEDEDDDNVNENKEQQVQTKKEVSPSVQLVHDAKPVGEPIRFSGRGRGRRSHFESFVFNGIQYILVRFFFLTNSSQIRVFKTINISQFFLLLF